MSIGPEFQSESEHVDARRDQCAFGLAAMLRTTRAGARLRVLFVFPVLVAVAFPFISTRAADQPSGNERFSQPESSPLSIPIFEKRYALRYRLLVPPAAVINPSQDFDRPVQQYEFDVRIEEDIQREDRVSKIDIDSRSKLLLAWQPSDDPDEFSPFEPIDWEGDQRFRNTFRFLAFPISMETIRRAGSSKQRISLSPVDGLVEEQNNRAVSTFRLADRLTGTQSLLAALSIPSSTRMRNGAILQKPKPPPVIEFARIEWFDYALLPVFPPLPEQAIPAGQTWQAGFLVLPSLYADATVVRGDIRFESHDIETGIATITWTAQTASQPIRPIPGIHHVHAGAIARINVNGRFRIHVATGWIESGSVELESQITNPAHVAVSATFCLNATLKGVQEPASVRLDRESRMGTGHNPVLLQDD
jgi:hypothetical protein